ncbi:MAG: hypothetical protein D6828_02385 [Nitrospirae bacterium]|nr:MAG: hypothetical protein D6828_02385 [Nitrospirota bacterium]
MKAISLINIFLIVLLFPLSVNAQEQQREGCCICGMYLDMYASTEHVIIYKDGSVKKTCSLACASKLYKSGKKRIKKILVADFLSHELIDAQKAYYLEGSDIPGVMSYTSRIAFKDKEKAIEFQKKHGGKIISFEEAVKHQIEE